MHKFSYMRYGNCLLYMLYLYITGKICAILVRKTNNRAGYYHFLGITYKNNIIHLTNKHCDRKHDCTPIYLYGQPEIFKRKLLRIAKYSILLGYDEHCERYFV